MICLNLNKKRKKTQKGFTLLEVLIALSVLAISMLAVYSLLNSSITMSTYGRDKLLVIDKGYERVLMHTHYPRLSTPASETYGNTQITYEYNRESTGLPTVVEVTLRVQTPEAVVQYEYFERSR